MSESGYYPLGAENDPRAPWNEQEPEECPDCEGSGTLHLYAERDFDEPSIHEKCERCDGTGCVEPPTREEIEEERGERMFDQLHEEGRI